MKGAHCNERVWCAANNLVLEAGQDTNIDIPKPEAQKTLERKWLFFFFFLFLLQRCALYWKISGH